MNTEGNGALTSTNTKKNGQVTAHINLWHPTNDSFDPTVTTGFKGIRNKLTSASYDSCF